MAAQNKGKNDLNKWMDGFTMSISFNCTGSKWWSIRLLSIKAWSLCPLCHKVFHLYFSLLFQVLSFLNIASSILVFRKKDVPHFSCHFSLVFGMFKVHQPVTYKATHLIHHLTGRLSALLSKAQYLLTFLQSDLSDFSRGDFSLAYYWQGFVPLKSCVDALQINMKWLEPVVIDEEV